MVEIPESDFDLDGYVVPGRRMDYVPRNMPMPTTDYDDDEDPCRFFLNGITNVYRSHFDSSSNESSGISEAISSPTLVESSSSSVKYVRQIRRSRQTDSNVSPPSIDSHPDITRRLPGTPPKMMTEPKEIIQPVDSIEIPKPVVEVVPTVVSLTLGDTLNDLSRQQTLIGPRRSGPRVINREVNQNVNQSNENQLTAAMIAEKGKPYDNIHPFKMPKSKGYKPHIRLTNDVLALDQFMASIYKNATDTDDVVIDLNSDEQIEHFETWDGMKLSISLIDVLKDKIGYPKPRFVQSVVIPIILEEKNVVVQAENAAGKTMSFVIPIIDSLINAMRFGFYRRCAKAKPYAIIIAPTRELATQICEQFNKIIQIMGVGQAVCCFGEYDVGRNEIACRNTEIIVGCPGRLADFLDKKIISTELLKFVVLDEVDKYTDGISFQRDLSTIRSYLPVPFQISKKINENDPKSCQYLFFTATIDSDAFLLIDEWIEQNNYRCITNVVQRLASKIQFKFEFVTGDAIRDAYFITNYIKNNCYNIDGKPTKALVFCERRDEAYKMATMLQATDFYTNVLSSDMAQEHRDKVMKELRDPRKEIIVFATNVASRGLDIPEVENVVILKFGFGRLDFVNRSGRTGRLKTGTVHVFIEEFIPKSEIQDLIDVMRTIKHPIPEEIQNLANGNRRGIHFKTA